MTTQIVFAVEAADLLTPILAYTRLAALAEGEGGGTPYQLLFESVEGGETRGRYSVIALLPDLVWKCREGHVSCNRRPNDPRSHFAAISDRPIDSLRALMHESHLELPPGFPPMIAGIFGYLGYDLVRQIEDLPSPPSDDLHLPDGIMIRPTLFAVFDSLRDEVYLAIPIRKDGLTAAEGNTLLERARRALFETSFSPKVERISDPTPIAPQSAISEDRFKAGVARAIEYIEAGDAFQIVLSQRFQTSFPLSALALYRALRRINPAPFLFLLELDDFALVGSSPEILVRLRDHIVTLRPLAGTRPRGETPEDDRRLEVELLNDEKERSEHLMLIDLGRNDVGRVSKPGSVEVPEQFVIEKYSHVMHISSTVTGRIATACDAIDTLAAALPAGTLSGAPKIRAMEIIDELEATRRGPYAGCIGYIGSNGEMDTCIGLRMAVLKNGQMYVQAGCGIVADSQIDAEFEETRHKARALFRAAELALETASR